MKYSGDKSGRRPGTNPGGPGSEDAYARGADAGPNAEEQAGRSTADFGTDEALPDAEADPAAEPLGLPAADGDRALEEQRDKYLRLAAEYDNYRRRTVKERQEAGGRAQAELVKLFTDSLDDLGRFAELDPSTTDATTVVQGVDLVNRKLLKALAAAGLQVIDPIDQPFDPALHEAVMTEPALSAEDDHLIARVFQKGFVHNGQLIRPARVVVKQWNG